MLLPKDQLLHINSIAHEGKVIVFATAQTLMQR